MVLSKADVKSVFSRDYVCEYEEVWEVAVGLGLSLSLGAEQMLEEYELFVCQIS